MPLRRSHVHALDVIAYSGDARRRRLDLHVSSGTYVRAIANALGGHCTTLRRLAVGPFGIDEADRGAMPSLLPAALRSTGCRPRPRGAAEPRGPGCSRSNAVAHGARLTAAACGRQRDGASRERRRIGRPSSSARPRAVAIGTFDGVHRGHRR